MRLHIRLETLMIAAGFLLLLSGFSMTQAIAADTQANKVIGAWRGSLDYVRPDGRNQPVYFGFNVEEKENKLTGAIRAYQIGLSSEIKAASVRRNKFSFDFSFMDETARFSAKLDGDRMNGVVNWSQGARTVTLQRVNAGIDQAFVTSLGGLYEFDDGGELIVVPSSWTLDVYDNESLDYRGYFPVNDSKFIAGSTYLAPTPAETELSFEKAPDDSFIVTQTSDAGSRTGKPSAKITQEEVSFNNGDVELKGFLIRPSDTSEKTPGVVVVWGSGRQNRYGYQGLPYHRAVWLARKGFSAIVFDKRGVGESTGSYDDRTNELMAGDVAAAAAYLAARPEVDADQIGMVAHSQSGIYAPITIGMSKHIKFAAIISTTIVNGEIQEIVRTGQQLRADGWPAQDITDAVATQILKFYYADTRIGWDAYVSSYHRVAEKPWFDVVIGSTIDPEHSAWDFWKNNNSYEPSDHWGDVNIPVFFLYGDHDPINPVDENIKLLNGVYGGSKAPLFKLKLYANADHSLFIAHEGGILEESAISKLHPYLDDIVDWMEDIGVTTPAGN